jgi:PAS domain S-box-containing protein
MLKNRFLFAGREPTPSPLPGGEPATGASNEAPLLGEAEGRFIARAHGLETVKAFHDHEGRARHSVRAATGQWAHGAQGTDAPCLDNFDVARSSQPWTVGRNPVGILFLYAFVWLLFQSAQAGQAPVTEEVTTFQQFYNLHREQVLQGRPIRFKGVVLCYDSDWNQLYIYEGREAHYFNAKDFRTKPQFGQLVEITGRTTLVQNNSALTNLDLTILGQGMLPAAKRLEPPQFATDFSQWVETIGRVRVAETSRGRLGLLLHDNGHDCLVYVMGPLETNDFNSLLDCKVRVQGINTSKIVNGRLESASMLAPGPSAVTILERPVTNRFQAPAVAIGSLLSRAPGPWTNSRVRINGLVVSHQPGQSLVVKDPTGVIRAQAIQVNQAEPDSRVDVWGFPTASPERTVLKDAFFAVMAPPRGTISPSASEPPTATANAHEVLTQVSQIRQLRRDQASQQIPVRLRGVITYADPGWRNCFIQDQSGGVYVDLNQTNIRSGQWVELTGHTGPGGFTPEILNSRIQVLGNTNLPAPVKVGLEDLADGQLDCHWVELKGVVRRLSERDGHVYLIVTTGKGRFKALLPGFDGRPAPTHLIDALVSVQGACGTELNAQRQIRGIALHVPSLDQVKILEPAPTDPFAVEPTPIGSVATFDPNRLSGRRVKVSGVVTLQIPGQGFIVQDASGGIRVHTSQTNEVHPGHLVDVLGFPAMADFSPSLEEASFRTTGTGALPPPRKTTADQILLKGTHDGLIVQMEARVLQNQTQTGKAQLVLQDGSIIFTAQTDRLPQNQEIPSWPSGSLVRLTGVCSIEGNEAREAKNFRLLVRSASDVTLVSRPPWWSTRHTFWLLAGAAAVLFVSLAWVSLLRRQVSQRTRELQEENAERQLAEEALRESQLLYLSLVDHLPINVFRKDRDGRFTFVNSRFCQFKGMSVDQILGKTVFDLYERELAEKFTRDDQTVLETGQVVDLEEERRDAGGKAQHFHVVKTPVFASDGTIAGTQGMFYEITARKQAEAELAYERDLLRTLLDNSPDQIYFKDLESRFLKCSQTLAERFGRKSVEDVLGRRDSDFFKQEHARPAWEDEQEIIRTGRPIINKVEKEYWKASNKITWVLTTKVPLQNKTGAIIGTFGISKDITTIKEAEAKLEEVHQQLLDTSRQAGMAEVATGVLHNVGNVLNSVNVSASLVAEHVKDWKVANLAKAAAMLAENVQDPRFLMDDEKGKHLPKFFTQLADLWTQQQAAVVEEITSLTKNVEHIKDIVMMQQAYATVSGVTEIVHLSGLVDDALRMNAGSLERHDVQVNRNYQEIEPLMVDKHKVLQILVNLIRNAKYACDESDATNKEIRLRIARNGDGRVKIEVQDNGVGIPKENLTRIFAHGFTTRRQGHGFGLHSGALAAKEMGGELHVRSDGPGLGATFTLELPAKSAERNAV